MSSCRTSNRACRLLGVVTVVASTLALVACDDDDPPAVVPHAGIVAPADLPPGSTPKLVTNDRTVANGCTLNNLALLSDRAKSRYFVEYQVDSNTEVRSYLYTFTNHNDLEASWKGLRDGNLRCQAEKPSTPGGTYQLLTGLPATATGFHTTSTSDTQVTSSEQVWSRRGADDIVSVAVVRTADRSAPPPELSLSAKDLAAKAAT